MRNDDVDIVLKLRIFLDYKEEINSYNLLIVLGFFIYLQINDTRIFSPLLYQLSYLALKGDRIRPVRLTASQDHQPSVFPRYNHRYRI